MSNNSGFNSFSTNKGNSGTGVVNGAKDFFESNSLVAKLAFLLLVLVAFIFLLKIGINVINALYAPSESPRLIDGMIDATQMTVFTQDPSSNGAVTIYRSNNTTDGIEFSWSVWMYVSDLQYLEGKYRTVFYKGNYNFTSEGLNYPNNAPGLYIAPYSNALVVKMNTFQVIDEEVTIPDIPLNKWFNVIIRCQSKVLDVFINGTIARSLELLGVPKQNYGDVYACANGGFSGYISNLWYYNYALGTAAIQNLVNNGPNTKTSQESSLSIKDPNFLSLRWYFGENSI